MATDHRVNEELLHHFRSLVQDKLAEGLTFDEAWDAAERQFGPLWKYGDECRVESLREQLYPGRAAASALVLMVLLLGWLALEVRSMGRSQGALLAQTQARPKPAGNQTTTYDLTGRILDQSDKPIAGATVMLILKTWPNDRYRQADFNTQTDEQGRYRFEKLIPGSGQYAVNVTALHAGSAFQSKYVLVREASGKPAEVDLQLGPSQPVTLRLKGGNGQPLVKAGVLPSARRTRSGEEHLIYFQGSEVLRADTDAQGEVAFDACAPGDEAQVYVQPSGGDWTEYTFTVPSSGEAVDISLP